MAEERAVIYVPDGAEGDRWLGPCVRYVHRRGYELVAVVREDWTTAYRFLIDGRAQVLVTALRDHPPADRVPRVEFLEEEGPAPTRGRRRPRPLTQQDAEE